MSPLRRGVVCAFALMLAAATLFAQGNRPATPGAPISGSPVPEVVDRNDKVVGPLSADTGIVFTLPDGRKTLLSWHRMGLGTIRNFGSQTKVYFRTTDCSGPAFVDFAFEQQPRGDAVSLALPIGEVTFEPYIPSEGSEPPTAAIPAQLYASESGGRPLLRLNDFQSYLDPNPFPFESGFCVSGPPPIPWPEPYVPLYRLDPTGIDLSTEFEHPFHVRE